MNELQQYYTERGQKVNTNDYGLF